VGRVPHRRRARRRHHARRLRRRRDRPLHRAGVQAAHRGPDRRGLHPHHRRPARRHLHRLVEPRRPDRRPQAAQAPRRRAGDRLRRSGDREHVQDHRAGRGVRDRGQPRRRRRRPL
ncbi:MAG: hypothetical protein AVDCRST_MAG30-3163, partial [uncultured Solirubrobacteraceae bacterium]